MYHLKVVLVKLVGWGESLFNGKVNLVNFIIHFLRTDLTLAKEITLTGDY
jgi:hypothetical protein